MFFYIDATIFNENPKKTLKRENFVSRPQFFTKNEETPLGNKINCKRPFSDEYLDQLEKKLGKVASKRSRNSHSSQNNMDFDGLLQKYSPYKKIEINKTEQTDALQEFFTENNEKINSALNEDLRGFLSFLGKVDV